MQFQKQVDELAAVYEKNVGPIETETNLDEPVAVGYDERNEGLEGRLSEGEKAKPDSVKLVVRDSKFEDFEGNVDWETWAPNEGRVPGTIQEGQTLGVGMIIDRYGHPYGRYTSPVGVPYEQRALPYIEDPNTYHQYEVIKPIDNVTISKIAEAFEQPGGGIQYELPLAVDQLVKDGYLKEITK